MRGKKSISKKRWVFQNFRFGVLLKKLVNHLDCTSYSDYGFQRGDMPVFLFSIIIWLLIPCYDRNKKVKYKAKHIVSIRQNFRILSG